jgi:hypothetical protein
MKRSGAFMLLIFVLFIAFIYWYFIFRNPCEPIIQCKIPSTNITCTSNNDCFSSSATGVCNMNTFKCVNMILNTKDKKICSKAGGEWIEVGC